MRQSSTTFLTGELLEEDVELTLGELCRACQLPAERMFVLIEEGIIEPSGRDATQWRFQGINITRVQRAQRLERDLGINPAGIALALELLEEMEQMRHRLQRLEG